MNLTRRPLFALAAISVLILNAGCSDRDLTELRNARGTIDPVVFDDEYGHDVYYQPFLDTHVTAVSIDSVFAYDGFSFDGARSLKFNIPPAGSALGIYTGGVLTSAGSRDMADFNALTFYARADHPVTLDIAGFGNDNTGTSLYEAGRPNVSLNEEWTFIIVPIPEPSKLISERGMFTFAEGLDDQYPEGYNIWLDEIRYATLDNIVPFRPSMASGAASYFLGSTVNISGTRTIFKIDAGYVPIDHSPFYFDYATSDPEVAAIKGSQVQVVGVGTASITAMLGKTEVLGRLDVTGHEPPATAAASPTLPAGDVISLFSDVYDDVQVDTWRADWGGVTTRVADYIIDGNNAKVFSSLNWVGIQFQTQMVDVSEMTHFHLDVYAPEGASFVVKLNSYPPGSNELETHEFILDETTTPAFIPGAWSSLEIPLENFPLPSAEWDWSRIGQLVLASTNTQLVLVDNIYWHK